MEESQFQKLMDEIKKSQRKVEGKLADLKQEVSSA